MNSSDHIAIIQWALVIITSLLLIFISPKAKSLDRFFKASKKGKEPGLWVLTSSLVISWIFAKSITNAANLGLKYGIVGGLAYATYYLSFLVAGIIIYEMRIKGGYMSIHHFLSSKFGLSAVLIFSILIGFRLFNEVWSNTMVIGGYFGEIGSSPYYASILVFTLLTLVYTLKGGLSSSLLTDVIQMVLFGGLLLVILAILLPEFTSETIASDWSLSGGLDLLLVALIQSLSYPFHDPVMTDRGFITEPRKMRKAFLIAVPIGFSSIVLFSLIGAYAAQLGVVGDATVQVAKATGVILMVLINFIMITSASSTLDSAFSSFAKLWVMDLHFFKPSVFNGRLVMGIVAVLGTVPVFFDPSILSATTISGTMVIGLAPIFLFWNKEVPKHTFTWVVLIGVLSGILLTVKALPDQWIFFNTDYGDLLTWNIIGSLLCFGVFGWFWVLGKKNDLAS